MTNPEPVETGYVCRDAFRPYHMRTQRFAAMVYHRRAGKTVSAINDLIDDTLRCALPNPRAAYIAPLYRQAKEIAWDYAKRYSQAIPGTRINESELRIDYPNGGRFRLYGADNPDSMRGIYLDAAVMDEPAQMKPMAWAEVIRPALADRRGRCTFIGTPKGRDWFYEMFRNAERDADWYTLTLRASQSGLLPEEEILAMSKVMTPSQIAQELECSFDEQSALQFLSTFDVNQSMLREALPETYAHAPRVLGVDIARHGDDESCIIRRQGIKAHMPDRFRIPDLMSIAGKVVEHIEDYRPDAVFIDATGMGWGVIDRLKQVGYARLIHAVQTGERAQDDNRYYNHRAELWGRMRDWLREAGCMPMDDAMLRDLTAPEYHFDNRNRTALEKKEDMKARGIPSPDSGDALALTFHSSIAPRTQDDTPEWKRKLRARSGGQRHPMTA